MPPSLPAVKGECVKPPAVGRFSSKVQVPVLRTNLALFALLSPPERSQTHDTKLRLEGKGAAQRDTPGCTATSEINNLERAVLLWAPLCRSTAPQPIARQLVSLRGFRSPPAACPLGGGGGGLGGSCWDDGGRRGVWGEAAAHEEVINRDSFYDTQVETWATKSVRKLTLRQLLNFGRDAWFDQERVLESARFVQQELPKRLARRLMDLQLLPYIVVNNPNIRQVYNAYYHGFMTLKDLPPIRDMTQNDSFAKLLRRLVDEHSPMLDALAQGMREVRSKPVVGEQLHLDGFLENMLRSRISRRVMAEQHINLNNPRPGYIGIVCTQLNLADAVDFAASRCKQAFMEHYGIAPEVHVSGDTSLTIPYIPAHLDYMLYELLKNSARALVERHLAAQAAVSVGAWNHNQNQKNSSSSSLLLRQAKLPPIHARVCAGEQDVTIRLSDQGGGIDPALVDAVWQFGFTTTTTIAAPSSQGGASMTGGSQPRLRSRLAEWGLTKGQPEEEQQQQQQQQVLQQWQGLGGGDGGGGGLGEGLGLDNAPPGTSFGAAWAAMENTSGMGRFRIAGLGFGLPLSRLYARYFGGDLGLINMPGYGVDAYLTLKRLEDAEWVESNAELQTGTVVHRA